MILHYSSSINWCEADYVYFNFIAEFWNAISGFFLIYSAYYFKINNKVQVQDRFITDAAFYFML
jgi:hypothetical protein